MDVLLETREDRNKIQEFQSKARFDQSKETEAIISSKCALIEVLELFWKFQTNSLVSVLEYAFLIGF